MQLLGIIKISTLKKREASYTCFFLKSMFRDTKTQPEGCRYFSPPCWFWQYPSHPKLTPLASNACHSYVTHTILASQPHGGINCACNCEARIGSLEIPVVKIVPQQPKIRNDNDDTSVSISLDLNASLRRIPICHHRLGMGITLPKPLAMTALFCCHLVGCCIENK